MRTVTRFLLSKADSNHHKQNQNLLCYHYTIGQSLVSGCKISKYLANCKIFATFFRLLDNQQVVVLLTLLSQQILAVDEVIGGNGTVLVSQFLLVQADSTTLHHLTHLTL